MGDPRATKDSDEVMTNLTEKGRPPDKVVSWAERVSGTSAGGKMVPEDKIDAEFVKARLRVEFPHGEEGEPEITIGEEVLEAMNGLWKNCMIVKVLGRSVPIAVLSRKLREMWKPAGPMYVVDLPRQYFLVRFGDEEEYLTALTGGPWKAFGGYLMAQAWSPQFDPMKDVIVTTSVWVRLSNLPVNFYHKSILMGIATGLGKPVKVDDTTLNVERARFARVCVEVDLRKPLKGSVRINNERYYVAYEGMSNICSHCGIYGHLIHTCPLVEVTQRKNAVTENAVVETRKELPEDEGFTAVRRPNRRSKNQTTSVVFTAGGSQENLGRNLQEIPKITEKSNIVIANSFGQLESEMIEVEKGETALISEENKENQLPRNPNVKGKGISVNLKGKIGGEGKNVQGGGKGNLKGRWAEAVKARGLNGPRMRVEGESVGRREAPLGLMIKREDEVQGFSDGQTVTISPEEMKPPELKQTEEKGVQDVTTTSSHAMELGVA